MLKLIIISLLAIANAEGEKVLEFNGKRFEAESAEWFQCTRDEDCVDISYSCAGAAVNKKFAKVANELYRNQNMTRDCAIRDAGKNDPPFKVFCKNKKCGSQRRNPKMGFS